MKPKIIAYSELALLALAIALFLWWAAPEKVSVEDSNLSNGTTTPLSLFPTVEIEAKAAYVYDVALKKSLYEKEPELQWPLASLTKLMSALTAASIIPDYMLVRIEPEDLREEGDSGLLTSEEWNVGRLIDYSLMVSSNDGMHALASVAGAQIVTPSDTSAHSRFVDEMNRKAKELGLAETYFLNQSGLDVTSELSGGYGSAKDMTLLIEHILSTDPHLLEATSFDSLSIDSKHATHFATNTNKAILQIPNVLGSKTGYTDLSGGNVVVAWNAGLDHPIIISILGSSYEGRFTDLKTLVDATLEYLSKATTTVSIPENASSR